MFYIKVNTVCLYNIKEFKNKIEKYTIKKYVT